MSHQDRCHKCKKLIENACFAVLDGGALRHSGRRRWDMFGQKDALGFLDVAWHGGIKDSRDCLVQVVRASSYGQFELHFCTTRCLRRFLSTVVDDLEKQMRAQKNKSFTFQTSVTHRSSVRTAERRQTSPARSRIT